MEYKLGKHIGTGGACDVFEYGFDKVIKLYFEGYSMDNVHREYDKTFKVWKYGLPVPHPYEVIEINGRFGLVMERIYGQTFKDILFNYITGISDKNITVNDLFTAREVSGYIRKTAEVFYNLHCNKVEGMNDFSANLKWSALQNQYLTDEEGVSVCELIDTLPKGDRLCHGDPNPGNLIDNNGRITIIDWVNSGIGNPMCDLAEYVLMVKFAEFSEEDHPYLKELIYTCREQIIREFLDEYQKLSGADIRAVDDWLVPMAVSKLHATTYSFEQKQKILIFIRKKLQDWLCKCIASSTCSEATY